jgi:hypothetical protein
MQDACLSFSLMDLLLLLKFLKIKFINFTFSFHIFLRNVPTNHSS